MPVAHPQKAQLIAFGQGKLAADESSSVELHLEVCRECCETLLDLTDDTFVGLVKIAQSSDSECRTRTLARSEWESGKTESGKAATGNPPKADRSTGSKHAAMVLVQSGEPDGADELPPELADHPRYRIVELIGRGGMGSVYRAEHRLMNRPVAIKLINPQLVQHPHAVERFRREVRAAAKLTHPNIVTAYDAEQAGDVHYLVMEFVEGTDLASVVKHRGPMAVAEACECIRQVALGLQHAHESGMVHRDIKPHNLMLSAKGQVRILDFGLAGFAEAALESSPVEPRLNSRTSDDANPHDQPPDTDPAATRDRQSSRGATGLLEASAAHLTTAGSVMGSPDYIAPEQAVDAHSADIRADIYSLGCTLHFMLTGKPPFEAENVLAKLKAHANDPPLELTTLRNDVPVELSKVAARMMAKNPAERFQTPAEVAAALTPFAEAVSPPRRRIGQAIAAAFLFAALILAVVVIYVQTDTGEFEIHASEEVAVEIEKSRVKIRDKVTDRKYQLTAGRHSIRKGEYVINVTELPDGLTVDTDTFRLTRGGEASVTVSFKPKESSAPTTASGESPIASLRDFVQVTAYLNDPRNNRGGSVPVALLGRAGRVAFRFGNWLVMFEGIVCDPKATILGFSNFNVPQPGSSGEGTVDFGAGDQLPGVLIKFKIAADQNEISINNNRFKLRGKATRLEFGDKTYDATNSLQTILVARDGSTRLQEQVAGQAPAATPAATDEQRLQGKWIAVSGHAWKKLLTATELAQLSITFDGQRVEFVQPPGPPTPQAVTFTINSNRDPKQIDFVAPGKQEAMPGIYQFDGERLKLALIDLDYSRPTNFDPDHRPGHLTAVFERVSVAATLGEEERKVLKAAEEFLAVLDVGKLDQLHDISSTLAKRAATKEQALKNYQLLAETVGKATQRTLQRVWLIDEFPALPAGRYASVQFKTQFAKRQGMMWESAVLNVDPDGQWRVNTYAATLEPLPIPGPKREPGFQPASTGKTLDQQAGGLPRDPPAAVPTGANLITDPSFENTGLTQLPRDWRAWTNEDSDFRCEVVKGGHTGQRSLLISGKGIRGVIFGNDIKADRTKRYALKGWAKFEGNKDARAIIKFNYFRGSEFLGVHDLVGVTADQPGWQLVEKTDALDAYPQADHFYAMCHVEGSGTGWFDDLELVAYDRDKQPADFDARHGRHNRLTGPNSLDRWVGTWETEYVFRETDDSPMDTKLTMNTPAERTLGGYFLMSHDRAVADDPKTRQPRSADATANLSAIGGDERLRLLTFDQNVGAFREWLFSSNGKAFEWRGQWDDAAKSLELRLLPDASNLFSTERFVDAEHIAGRLRFQYVMGMKDAGGWTATRKAVDGKVDVLVAKSHVAALAELSQLDKFAGEWTIHAKYKPSVWNPQPREETIRETSVWILGGRFLMTRAFNEKDELTSIWIATYEPKEKSNRFWFFNADGSSGEWRLTWDGASSGFHFRAIDTPTGWSGTGFNRWVNEDTFDNQALIKDENGRVLLDMTQDRLRRKP